VRESATQVNQAWVGIQGVVYQLGAVEREGAAFNLPDGECSSASRLVPMTVLAVRESLRWSRVA
jgi:hypothetical protein